MLTLGILLFPVYAGILPYYENGLFGLLLVILALQIVYMGKTPFGDMQRSRITTLGGTSIAALGIVTCFVPGILGSLPRIILSFALGAGGLVLFLQLFFTQNRYRLWRTYGGIFNHLIVACDAVYLCQTLIAILIFKPSIFNAPLTISAVLAYAFALTYLACVLQIINRRHPSKPEEPSSNGGLSLNNATLLLMGVFMLILGLLTHSGGPGSAPVFRKRPIGPFNGFICHSDAGFGEYPYRAFPANLVDHIFGIYLWNSRCYLQHCSWHSCCTSHPHCRSSQRSRRCLWDCKSSLTVFQTREDIRADASASYKNQFRRHHHEYLEYAFWHNNALFRLGIGGLYWE